MNKKDEVLEMAKLICGENGFATYHGISRELDISYFRVYNHINQLKKEGKILTIQGYQNQHKIVLPDELKLANPPSQPISKEVSKEEPTNQRYNLPSFFSNYNLSLNSQSKYIHCVSTYVKHFGHFDWPLTNKELNNFKINCNKKNSPGWRGQQYNRLVKMNTFFKEANSLPLTISVKPDKADGGFIAQCNEVPAAISQGRTKKQAKANVAEVLREHFAHTPRRPGFIRRFLHWIW